MTAASSPDRSTEGTAMSAEAVLVPTRGIDVMCNEDGDHYVAVGTADVSAGVAAIKADLLECGVLDEYDFDDAAIEVSDSYVWHTYPATDGVDPDVQYLRRPGSEPDHEGVVVSPPFPAVLVTW